MQPQLLGISSGDESQRCVEASQTESSIYDFGVDILDLTMISTGAQVAVAPGDVEYTPDLWGLRYGPNVELVT